MSGKRVLDAIALLSATRNVAVKHFDIRVSQLDLYSKTSSLGKALRNRIQRDVPIGHTSTQPFSNAASSSAERSQETQIPAQENVQDSSVNNPKDGEPMSDHHYERSKDNAPIDPAPKQELDIEQEKAKRNPLPDGTIPPEGSSIKTSPGDLNSFNTRPVTDTAEEPLDSIRPQQGLKVVSSRQSTIPDPEVSANALSSEEAMILQRQSESQIPSQPAEPPEPTHEFGVEQEQDVFYQPPGTTSPVLSALPRMRVPKVEWDVQGGDPHIPRNTNADVYYSGKANTYNAEEEPSEEALSQMFHSPRVARILGGKPTARPSSARAFHTQAFRLQRAESEKEDIKQLAADMAKDAQNSRTITQQQSRPAAHSMRESRVPSSRFGRMFEYGGLAASMAFGAVSESISGSNKDGPFMLSAANTERLVAKLSKMRGAALKLGQMMSFQDSKMLPKPIHDVLQRVQDSADYMPPSQRDGVIAADLGPEWRELFESFEEKPMAAASIGQVHGAVLKSGQRLAVKVQYPGVADSISSDLNNLSLLLNASRLLPKGLYLDKTIANARTELAWECDYVREAEAAQRFHDLLSDDIEIFTVPAIIGEASGKRVLTMERMEGVAVTKIQNFTQEQRDWIGTQILRLCLREIVEFRFMQTDPNWTNFLYNSSTNKIELLDFGASREFPDRFIDLYVQVLSAAARSDRDACRSLSIELGYLTGYESKAMLNAHIDSMMALAEPFMENAPEEYDFRDQTITERVRGLIPVMVRERLAPPPEETYSLHRKLSGAFLLCARLGSRVRCRELFKMAVEVGSGKRDERMKVVGRG